MSQIDHLAFRTLVKQLYATVHELERLFPGRHFTPDGHMVGSLGEALVADAYDVELLTASNKGFDALSSTGQQVEIKATQANRVAFRHQPAFAIVLKIFPDGTFAEIYDGPGQSIWLQFDGKPLTSNGQYIISLAKLRSLNATVAPALRIPKRI